MYRVSQHECFVITNERFFPIDEGETYIGQFYSIQPTPTPPTTKEISKILQK